MISSSIGKAFGRVNLLGEHLDYNGGCVLPLQINKAVTIKLEYKSDIEGILIKSRDYEEEISIINYSKKLNNWADFIIGSCDYFNRFYKVDIKNVVVNIDSDLPIGIGLSSSAATCVSMIRALSNFFEINLDEPTTVNSHVVVIRPSEKIIVEEFLYWYFQSNSFQKYCVAFTSGTTVPLLSQESLKNVIIPIPNITEQQKIISILSNCKKLIVIEIQYLEKLQKIKRGLMQQLLTGQKRVKM